MDLLFHDFTQAHLVGSGPLLSSTLSPIAPSDDPSRLRRISLSSTEATIAEDIRSGLYSAYERGLQLSKQEIGAWVDVYAAYWRVVNQLCTYLESGHFDHSNIYELWKELTNCLIKGYSSSSFAAWTVPCLYIAGRCLRTFAINADAQVRTTKPASFNTGMQDDVTGSLNKYETLEDAARIINRIFTLCISDR